jgi:ferredoxin/flavodoxin---NADP+ reductase
LYTILLKRKLNSLVTLMEVDAPYIAKKAQAGQFIILRIDEQGERIPLTIADYDRERGSITIIFQVVGQTTKQLDSLEEGDSILDFVGPLGEATELGDVKRVAVIGGGVGCAIAYPQAKALHEKGIPVDVIAGFRNKEAVILEDAFQKVSNHLIICTDDGSYQHKGLVTEYLQSMIDEGNRYDLVIAIGPIPMMKFVSKVTEPYAIKTIVSLNPIMIDGTGMCGGCRVLVNNETKFACIDGPDFDGHQVNYDDLMLRNRAYKNQEQQASRTCRLTGGLCHE